MMRCWVRLESRSEVTEKIALSSPLFNLFCILERRVSGPNDSASSEQQPFVLAGVSSWGILIWTCVHLISRNFSSPSRHFPLLLYRAVYNAISSFVFTSHSVISGSTSRVFPTTFTFTP